MRSEDISRQLLRADEWRDPGSYLFLDPGLKESRLSDKTTDISTASGVSKIKIFKYLFGCRFVCVCADQHAFFWLGKIAPRGAVGYEQVHRLCNVGCFSGQAAVVSKEGLNDLRML